MSGTTSNTGSPHRDRINTSDDYEVSYWSEKFGLRREELIEAVRISGRSSADAIEVHLKGQK